jgi:hypothetical protein
MRDIGLENVFPTRHMESRKAQLWLGKGLEFGRKKRA